MSGHPGKPLAVLAAIVAAASGSSANALSIDNASFYEEAFCMGEPIAYGTSDLLPESVSLDVSVEDQECVVGVLTSAYGPQLDVQASATNATLANGKARIIYYMQIEPLVAGAPEGPVRVNTTVVGSVSARATDGGPGSTIADAFIEIWVPDPIGSSASGGYRTFFAAACDDGNSTNGAGCDGNSQTNVELNERFDLYLPVGQQLEVIKRGEAGAGLGIGAADAQAIADPVFQIAPEFSAYYTIVFSPNVAVVPLPASAWMLASGLFGLAGLRRRTRARAAASSMGTRQRKRSE